MKCYRSVTYFALINGFPVRYFECSRGLHQGDLLSPFLFLMVVEALGSLLKAFQGGLLEGCVVGKRNMVVSHLQFADDTLVFYKNSCSQTMYLPCVIRCVEAVSELWVNLSMSRLFGVGHNPNICRLDEVLGC